MIRPHSKTLGLYQIRTLFNLQIPKPLHETPSIIRTITSLSSQFQQEFATQETQIENNEYNEKLKKKLRKLEAELRTIKTDSTENTATLETFYSQAVGLSEKGQNQQPEPGLKKLSNLFSGGGRKPESRTESRKEDLVMELSDDMAVFANYLHTKGYFRKANFLPDNKFDVSYFVNEYGRDFLKFAAEEFAKDNREIYKWLPTGDMKKVAQFGCPSLGRKTVFSAKAMRFCFGIREETVCNKCSLKESCKFVNQSVWKKGAKNMDLAVVMRVIILYALKPTRSQVPDDVRNAVNRLLKEVVRLGEIES